jgi:hypothetical protein
MTNNDDTESDFETDENDTDSEFEDAMQLPDMILDQIAEQAEITASEHKTTKQLFHKTDLKELPYGEILDLDMVKHEQQIDQDLCPIIKQYILCCFYPFEFANSHLCNPK